ncbi:MAG: adenylate/guanylate cyclase domain-containing protein [Planctomycetota bacterium]
MAEPNRGRFDLTPEELAGVDSYRRRKDTAVLTIMFTDIKGFTRITEERGDAYANDLRRWHDAIVTAAIEEDGAGHVVKHIGDAVMAVFSEPSSAVHKAMAIQRRLAAANREHPDQEPILVRIGLHMGQVTTENTVDLDVFGRHVNRASRVEGPADGGQVFLTYAIFDSARGWLNGAEDETIAWHLHGDYFVKGITEPLAISDFLIPIRNRSCFSEKGLALFSTHR